MTLTGSRPDDARPAPSATVARTVALVVGAFALAGVAAGVAWSRLAGRTGPVEMFMTQFGPYPSSEVDAGQLVAMDGWYAVVGAVGGLVLGAIFYGAFHRHGLWVVAALTVGGLLAAAVALAVGTFVANDDVVVAWQPDAEIGHALRAPLTLRAYGAMVVWPLAALLPVLVIGWLVDDEGSGGVVHTSEPLRGTETDAVR